MTIMPSQKEIEYLQLAARLACSLCCKGVVDFGGADGINLHELALAGLGYVDEHPQVPLSKIEEYVLSQLGNEFNRVGHF